MILASLLRMLKKLILFVCLCFDRIISVPHILVFIMSVLVLKAFITETLPMPLIDRAIYFFLHHIFSDTGVNTIAELLKVDTYMATSLL